MVEHMLHLARYNAWANARVYAAVAEVGDEAAWRDAGLFFGSVAATLNHLLVADRIWMRRFTGDGEHPARLDAILHRDLAALADARRAEDARILGWAAGLTEEALAREITYAPVTRPGAVTSVLWMDLLHAFNHQTHHRGQVHTGLLRLTGQEPPPLDMVLFARTLRA
ncbi:MAG: DinB family protein [Polyangiales bacterium]